jgi:glycosyltransferase involved in cell wall biosynthesis
VKILAVNSLYAPDIGGGAELILAGLCAGMRARGHEVMVAATTAARETSDEVVDGVPVVRLPLRNLYWHHGPARHGALQRLVWHARDVHNRPMGRALEAVIRRFDPDVVTFHNLAGFSNAAWDAAFAAGKPTVQVLHDYYNLCPRSQSFRNGSNCERPCASCRVFRRGVKAQSNGLRAVIGVSDVVLDGHVRNGLFAQVGLREVVNNARPWGGAPPRHHPPLARTFGFIGTVAEHKGVGRLLEAFSALASEPGMPALRLLVAGDGRTDYVEALRARYAADNIVFLGRVDGARFHEQIDVSVVPSIWHDPLPGVVYEAMLHGVPVIGSRRGGIPEMIRDGIDGLLFDPDAEGALAACMRELVVRDGLLERYGSAAREGARRFADMDRVVDSHLAVYREAIGA